MTETAAQVADETAPGIRYTFGSRNGQHLVLAVAAADSGEDELDITTVLAVPSATKAKAIAMILNAPEPY